MGGRQSGDECCHECSTPGQGDYGRAVGGLEGLAEVVHYLVPLVGLLVRGWGVDEDVEDPVAVRVGGFGVVGGVGF